MGGYMKKLSAVSKSHRFAFYCFLVLCAVFVLLGCPKRDETGSGSTVSIDTVPLPSHVFTLFDEAMAIHVQAQAGKVFKDVEIDITPINDMHPDLNDVSLFEYSQGEIQKKVDFRRQGGKLFADLSGSKTYLIFKTQKTGRILDTYAALCSINRFKPRIQSRIVPPICTQILCAANVFRAERLFTEFPSLNKFHDEMAQSMPPGQNIDDLQVGGWFSPGPGNVCELCTGFNPVDLIIPSPGCWDQPIFPSVRIEIEINQTTTESDDYLTWAPTFSRIRQVDQNVFKSTRTFRSARTVVLTNDPASAIPDGGDVLFAPNQTPWPHNTTATQSSLTLTLPGNGVWVPFVVAGKFGKPSSNDKDAVINVHSGTETGIVLGKKAVMVRVRKNANTLKTPERNRFLRALKRFRNKSSGGYLVFQELHRLAGTVGFRGDQAHHQPAFFPWHRALLLQVERELQKIDSSVTLPYWNWDEGAPQVFHRNFIGAAGNDTEQGAFIALPKFSLTNPLLCWDTDLGFAGGELRRNEEVHTREPDPSTFRPLDDPNDFAGSLISLTDFGPNDGNSFGRVGERRNHDVSHGWPCASGHLLRPNRSAADPLFYLLHSQVDRQWAYWQRVNNRYGSIVGGNLTFPAPVYYDNNGSWLDDSAETWGKGAYLEDGMWPWDGTTGGSGRSARPLNQAPLPPPGVALDDNITKSRPVVPSTPFPASSIQNLWPSVPTVVKPRHVIDYLGRFRPQDGLGFAYDDVPFAPRREFILDNLLLVTKAKQRAARIFVDPSQPKSKRLEAMDRIGYPDKPSFAALLKVMSNSKETDDIRWEAARRHRFDDIFIDTALKILKNPNDGGEQLNANLIKDLSRRAIFPFNSKTRKIIIEGLRPLLKDPRESIRLNSFRALAPAGDKEAIQLLTEGLKNQKSLPIPLSVAIYFINLAGSRPHLETIRPFLNHKDPRVQVQAVKALAVDSKSRAQIVQRVQSKEVPLNIRMAGLRALSHTDRDFTQYAFKVFGDKSENVTLRFASFKFLICWIKTWVNDRLKLEFFINTLEDIRKNNTFDSTVITLDAKGDRLENVIRSLKEEYPSFSEAYKKRYPFND
jgi:tyrosinase